MNGFLWGPVLAFCLVVGSPSARGFDCAKANLPVDFIICSDPAVIKANEAHEKAWYDARARLTDKEKQELLADQRRWLKEYPPRCGVPAQGKRLVVISRDTQLCVARALEERRVFLDQYHSRATQAPSEAERDRPQQQAPISGAYWNGIWSVTHRIENGPPWARNMFSGADLIGIKGDANGNRFFYRDKDAVKKPMAMVEVESEKIQDVTITDNKLWFTIINESYQQEGYFEATLTYRIEKVSEREATGQFRGDFFLSSPSLGHLRTDVKGQVDFIKTRLPWQEEPSAAMGSWIGCYADRGDANGTAGRDLDSAVLHKNDMTTETCVAYCAAKDFSYAGTQYATWCFCGEAYGKFGTSKECHMPCAGNPNETCGGVWANSVYSIDPSR